MPKFEVSREQLEDLIQAVMYLRTDLTLDFEMGERLVDLHIKLEDALELWINGGEVEIPVPPHYKAMGVNKWTLIHPPHDEGCKDD